MKPVFSSIFKSVAVICLVCVMGAIYLTQKSKSSLANKQTMQQVAIAAPAPAPVVVAPQPQMIATSTTLDPDPMGHFQANVEMNGRSMKMLVDTGASYVALTAEDARNIGINPAPNDYTMRMGTANGESRAAAVKLNFVRIGSISVYDVPAIVMQPGASNVSLLGMSFLKKLGGFEVSQGRLVLRQ